MRPAVALCVLSALVAASGVPLAAASRDLPQPTLFSGGKPWEKKPASYDKPLIGILAQVGCVHTLCSGTCWQGMHRCTLASQLAHFSSCYWPAGLPLLPRT